MVATGVAPSQATAQSWHIQGVCKPVEWARTHDLGVCDKNYRPVIKSKTLAVIADNGMERLLDCIAEKESSNGKNLFGDYRNGVPMAYGVYQIWLKYHPIGYDCAMDYDCARDYTRKLIEAGRGSEWTIYQSCLSI